MLLDSWFRVKTSNFWKPFPVRVFVPCLPEMGIALKARPRAMSGNCGDLRNVATNLEKPGHAVMTEVVKVKILNVEKLTRTRKSHSNRVGCKGKDLVRVRRHRKDNLKRFGWKITPDVISYFLTRVFHITHKYSAAFVVEIGSSYPCNFFEPAGRKNCEGYHFLHWYR